MLHAVFIGDEITAAAWRLIGMHTKVADSTPPASAFEAAIQDFELVLLAADFAARLPSDTLAAAIRHADPLIIVVADGGNRHAPDDLDAEVERVLGIEP